MLALVDYKYIRFSLFRKSPKTRIGTVFGMHVIYFTAEINSRSGRCKKSVKALRESEADMVCFVEGFPAKSMFTVREPVFQVAYEHLLPQIIIQLGFDGETALLVAGSDPRSGEMLKLLAQHYRYVLTCGIPQGELERLRRKAGASVIAEPSLDRIAEAQLAVVLRRPGKIKLGPECVVLAANMEFIKEAEYSKYVSQPKFDTPGDSPEGFDRRVLLSEALRRGALQWNRIMIENSQILTK